MQGSVDTPRVSRRSLAVSAIALSFSALVARWAVDDGDSYYSGSELDDWLAVVGAATACFLGLGLGLIRLPAGRGILLGTVLAVMFMAGALIVEAYVSVTTGPY